MTNDKVKIFVTYKDKHKLIKSDIITPIQTGRAIAKEKFEGMIGDDTGDNISKENPKYNELSAQYWVWKHYEEIGNPEYVGFMHYRRHFLFDDDIDLSEKKTWLPGMCLYNFEKIDEKYLESLSEEKILSQLTDNPDVVVLKPYNINLFGNNDLYMREHYISTIIGAKRINWDVFYDVVSELYPQYINILDKFTYGNLINCCNMFIMKKDVFMRCANFYFSILKEVDSRIDSSLYDNQELRFLGFLGEYILTLFVMILEEEHQLKVKYINGTFIENTSDKSLMNYLCIKKVARWFFEITNVNRHKQITLCGIKIKIKNKKKEMFFNIREHLYYQSSELKILENKISELQKELIVIKKQDK